MFNGENVSNMADALVRMKRGLAIVGDVPEFADGRDRIAVLESRLESAARPALLRALEMDKGVSGASNMVSSGNRDSIKFARDARDALRSIGKNESIEGAYAEARVVSPAMDFWVAFEEKTHNDGLIMNESSPNNTDKKTERRRVTKLLQISCHNLRFCHQLNRERGKLDEKYIPRRCGDVGIGWCCEFTPRHREENAKTVGYIVLRELLRRWHDEQRCYEQFE